VSGKALVQDPEGFNRRLAQYLEWLVVNHFSPITAESRAKYLKRLVSWCADRGVTRPAEVTRPVLERFQAALFHARKADGEPLSIVSQRNYITSVKGFFRWLARSNLMLHNPAADLLVPRLQRRLPKHVLTIQEAERVINLADVKTSLGLRDRAILETCYSTGLRRMELVALKLYDLDRDRGTLMVREGKGRSQRIIPIGERALRWVEKYLADTRPELVVPPDEGYLFLTHRGDPFTKSSLTEFVRTYVDRAELGKTGAVHLFRHTMATLMLEGGADIRYVQAMLGHAKLETTQIYTNVSIRKLKEVHTASHPAGRRSSPPKKALRAPPAASPPPEAEAATGRAQGARSPAGEPPGGGREASSQSR
jgi:integrase/recombinase XerD